MLMLRSTASGVAQLRSIPLPNNELRSDPDPSVGGGHHWCHPYSVGTHSKPVHVSVRDTPGPDACTCQDPETSISAPFSRLILTHQPPFLGSLSFPNLLGTEREGWQRAVRLTFSWTLSGIS